MESKTTDPDTKAILQKGGSKDPVSREGNKALEIERPLFKSEKKLKYDALKSVLSLKQDQVVLF